MDFTTDVNYAIENLFTTQHENNMETAHENAILDSWYDAQTYTEQLIDDSRNHNCLDENEKCVWVVDIDQAPRIVDCKLDPINETIQIKS